MLSIKTKCPHCGYDHNRVEVSDARSGKAIVNCDCDDGGCDKDYIIYFTTKVIVETHKIADKKES